MQSETRRRRFRSVTPSPSPSRSRSESRDGDRRSRNRSRSSSPRRSSRRQRSRTPTKRHPESSGSREKLDSVDGRPAPKRRISRSRSHERNGKHRSPTARRGRSRSPFDNRTKRSRQRSPYNDKDGKMVQSSQSTLPFRDFDRERAVERARQLKTVTPPEAPPAKKNPVDLMAQQQEMAITTRSGGAYIPPARLRAMQASITDKSTEAYQRMSWEALKKSINGLINKVNVSNLKNIVIELFGENLVRGRGLFARSTIRAQQASPTFTPVYAALVAIVNTKLPAVGALMVTRLISTYQRAFRRNDKTQLLSATRFIAHLVNQQVAHEIVALQILALLLERPTDDSVEVAVGFMREVGAFLSEASPKATHATFERFRAILHESQIDKRVQYMIEVLFQVRKDKFKNNPIKTDDLDIVEEDDQITHCIALDDDLDNEEGLDVFKLDASFEENEKKYLDIKEEILGASDSEGSEADGETDAEAEEEGAQDINALHQHLTIQDETETNLVNLRRTIYLTIMSSLDFEESVHKLLKMTLKPGQEIHMTGMIIECCSQERSYEKYYGLMGERFCKLNRVWADCYAQEFVKLYSTIHRFETNRIRNIAKFFGHLFHTDALPWTVFEVIKLTEEDTTSASRIFIKILLQEICEAMGIKQMDERFNDPYLKPHFAGILPTENAKDMRFSINFFTSIGLGRLTEGMREQLKNLPKLIQTRRSRRNSTSSDSSSASSSSSGSSSTSSSSTDSSSRSRRSRHSGRRRR